MTDQFNDPDLHVGDRYTAVGPDNAMYTDYIHSVRYSSAEPEIRQQPTGWRCVLRSLTPRRWRKPLPIIRPYRPEGMEIIGKSEYLRRAAQTVEDIITKLDRLGPK